MVLFLFFTSTIIFNLKPSSHHLPRLALLFAGGVILVYLMNEIKMLCCLYMIGSGFNLLCFQSHSKMEYHWTWQEVAIFGADQKQCGLWERECVHVCRLKTIFIIGCNAWLLSYVPKT